MNPNKNVVASMLLTLIMLLSIGQAPVEWDEGRDDAISLGAEQTDELTQTQARGVTGEQKVLVIGAKFLDMADTNNTKAELDSIFSGAFADFFDEISYGSISINADVYAWYDLPEWRANYTFQGDTNGDGVLETLYTGSRVCQDSVTALDDALDDAAIDFTSYDHVICLINGPWWRGWAYTPGFSNGFTISTSDGTLSIPATVVGETANNDPPIFWGRIAHEFGHMLGKRHVSTNYNNDYALMAGLYPGHMTAYKKYDGGTCDTQLDWLPEANIETAVAKTVKEYIIRPLELDVPGDIQAVKIDISTTSFYMIEVRKYIGFDATLDSSNNNIMLDQGVVIYSVDDSVCGNEVTIIDPDPTTPEHEAWQVGDVHADTVNGKDFQIEVLNAVGNGFNVKVSYDIVGLTLADVSITPWDAPPFSTGSNYYTPDIWIDSELNGWDRYRNEDDPDVPGDGSGDDPWVGNVNRLWFRITNNGQLAADDVEVKAYWSTPPMAGINTLDFEFIDTHEIEEIAPLSSYEGYIEWTPDVDGLESDAILNLHSCIVIEITELASGELSTADNRAQENIHRFETSSSSPFHAVGTSFVVNNPFDYHTVVYASIVDFPSGWDYELEWDMKVVDPNSKNTLNLSVTPPLFLSPFSSIGAEYAFAIAYSIDVAHYGGDITVEPHGGSSLSVVLVEEVDVNFDVIFDGDSINVNGNMISQSFTSVGEDYSGSFIAMEYWTPTGISILRPIPIGAGTSTCHSGFAPGTTIEIVYVSPSGQTSTSTRSMNSAGNYMDSYMMQDTGNWTVSYTYTDYDGNSHQWNEIVEVVNSGGQMAPVAEGYDKTCGIGTFIDFFQGTEAAPLTNGDWNVRVLFAGDSVHHSTVTSNQSVRVEGMPIVDPPVVDPPTVDPDIIIDPTFTPTITWGDDYLGSGTLFYPIATGANIAVLYTSPSGAEHHDNLFVDTQGRYSNTFSMDESGTWTVDYSYTDSNGVERAWSESVEVEEERQRSGIPSVGFISALSMVALAATLIRRRRID